MMGATLTQQYYFTQSTTDSQIESIAKSEQIRDTKMLVARQNNKNSETKTASVNGQAVTYASTAIRRVGEFSTLDKQTNSIVADDCRVGLSIIPQIIGFNIRPLWDPALPLEYFMSQNLSTNFREYLLNATLTFEDMANNCLNAAGQNCTANNGTCITVRTKKWVQSVGYCVFGCGECCRRKSPGATECRATPTVLLSIFLLIQNLNEQVDGTYAFTCVNNTVPNSSPQPDNVTYSFKIYLIPQIYQSTDDSYKNDITSSLYYYPYPTTQFLLQEVNANDDLSSTYPVRTCIRWSACGLASFSLASHGRSKYKWGLTRSAACHPPQRLQAAVSPGDAPATYRVVQSSTSKNNIQNILRIVVCPLYEGPQTLANTVPDSTCYSAFYIKFNKENAEGTLFAVEFQLDQSYPEPFNIQYYSYNAGNPSTFDATVTPVSEADLEDYITYGANWT